MNKTSWILALRWSMVLSVAFLKIWWKMKTSKRRMKRKKMKTEKFKLIPWEAGNAGIWSNTSQYIYAQTKNYNEFHSIYKSYQSTTNGTFWSQQIHNRQIFPSAIYIKRWYNYPVYLILKNHYHSPLRSANWNISHKNLVFDSTTALLQSYNVSYYVLKTTIHSTTVNNTLP